MIACVVHSSLYSQDHPEERLQHLHQHVEERVPAVPRALHRDGLAHGHEPALPAAEGHEDHAATALFGAQVSQSIKSVRPSCFAAFSRWTRRKCVSSFVRSFVRSCDADDPEITRLHHPVLIHVSPSPGIGVNPSVPSKLKTQVYLHTATDRTCRHVKKDATFIAFDFMFRGRNSMHFRNISKIITKKYHENYPLRKL